MEIFIDKSWFCPADACAEARPLQIRAGSFVDAAEHGWTESKWETTAARMSVLVAKGMEFLGLCGFFLICELKKKLKNPTAKSYPQIAMEDPFPSAKVY